MQRAHRALTLATCLASAALLLQASPVGAEPATAQSPEVALSERHAARAFEAYQRKDYAGAVALYQQALDAAPSADILYNIARVYDLGLRDRALATSYYERYVGDPGAIPSRIATANERLVELRAAEAAATQRPAARPAPPFVAAAPEPARPPPNPSDDGPSALTTGALVAGAVGLVGVGLGVGFGLAAKSDLDLSERYSDGNRCTSQRGVDAANSATREANVATVSFSVGGALLALGTVLWFVDDDDEQPEPSPQLGWSPRVGPNELSLSFVGSFGAP